MARDAMGGGRYPAPHLRKVSQMDTPLPYKSRSKGPRGERPSRVSREPGVGPPRRAAASSSSPLAIELTGVPKGSLPGCERSANRVLSLG